MKSNKLDKVYLVVFLILEFIIFFVFKYFDISDIKIFIITQKELSLWDLLVTKAIVPPIPCYHAVFIILLFIPILYRCCMIHFFEHSIEMFYILIPDHLCNAFYSGIPASKHCTRFFHSDLFENIAECHAWLFFNIFWQIWFWQKEFFRKIF